MRYLPTHFSHKKSNPSIYRYIIPVWIWSILWLCICPVFLGISVQVLGWVESKSVHKKSPKSTGSDSPPTPMIGDDLLIFLVDWIHGFLFISSIRVLFPAWLAGKKQTPLQYSCGGVFVASIFSRNKTLKNLNFDIASDSDLLWLLTWKGKAIKTCIYIYICIRIAHPHFPYTPQN